MNEFKIYNYFVGKRSLNIFLFFSMEKRNLLELIEVLYLSADIKSSLPE